MANLINSVGDFAPSLPTNVSETVSKTIAMPATSNFWDGDRIFEIVDRFFGENAATLSVRTCLNVKGTEWNATVTPRPSTRLELQQLDSAENRLLCRRIGRTTPKIILHSCQMTVERITPTSLFYPVLEALQEYVGSDPAS